VTETLLLVAAVIVAAAVGVMLTRIFRPGESSTSDETYLHALEHWIAGDMEEAQRHLTRVVHEDPSTVDPYLQLGNLLRLRGEAAKAAVMHRGLTVRPDLSRRKKVMVGLALAKDLVELQRWTEAKSVLDGVLKDATGRSDYWRVRFAQWYGQQNLAEAARTLKAAPRFCPERDRPWFVAAYAAFQLDRALLHAAAGEGSEAKARLRDVEKIPGTGTRAALVKAVLAASRNDAAGAITVASDELLGSPDELAVFLPLLQEVLLRSGQYARSIPILERACQAENAPATLWISLALLYEKLDQRDKALRLLESKAGRPSFTPDAAAPYLKHLVGETMGTDFARVWSMLAMPASASGWVCADCGHRDQQVRWFCTECRSFDSFVLAPALPGDA